MLVSVLTGTVFLFVLIGIALFVADKYKLTKREVSPNWVYKPLLINIIILGFVLSVTDQSFRKSTSEVAQFQTRTPLEFPLSSNAKPLNQNPLTSNYHDMLIKNDLEREVLDPIKQEVFDNFENLAITIRVLENGKPKDFSHKGIFNYNPSIQSFTDTQLSSVHSPRNYQVSYHNEVKSYVENLTLNSKYYDQNKKMLSEDPELSLLTSDIYQKFQGVIATLQAYEESLDQIMALNLANAETSRRSISMHDEKINRAKIYLAHAAASFSLTLDEPADAKQLEKYLQQADFDIELKPGNHGYTAAMHAVETFTSREQDMYQERVPTGTSKVNRNVEMAQIQKALSSLQPLTTSTNNTTHQNPILKNKPSINAGIESPNQASEVRSMSGFSQQGKIGLMVEKLSFIQDTSNPNQLVAGDVIVTLDGQHFKDPFKFSDSLKNHHQTSELTLGVMRDKKLQEIGVNGTELQGARLVPMLLDHTVQL